MFLPDHWHDRPSWASADEFPGDGGDQAWRDEADQPDPSGSWNAVAASLPFARSGQAFDRALRTVKEYNETVEYIHLNPVKAGLVARPEEWSRRAGSIVHDYMGSLQRVVGTPSGRSLDRILLPVDQKTRI